MDRILDTNRLAQMGRELKEELAGGQALAGSWIARAAKIMAEQMLIAEVEEALGRQRYQRRQEVQAGYRNGYKNRQLRTAEGKIEVEVPQVRGTEEPYRSVIFSKLGKRSAALQKLAVEMYARGLSTRDIEELLGELCEEEDQMLLSRSSVSGVTEALWQEYEAFTRRDLSGFEVVYLFCDAVYESLRQQGGCRQAILVT